MNLTDFETTLIRQLRKIQERKNYRVVIIEHPLIAELIAPWVLFYEPDNPTPPAYNRRALHTLETALTEAPYDRALRAHYESQLGDVFGDCVTSLERLPIALPTLRIISPQGMIAAKLSQKRIRQC